MNASPQMQALMEALAQKHGFDLSRPGATLALDLKGFDPLHITHLPNGCRSVGHFFKSQGMLVPEPHVCFFVDVQKGWIPINITQSLTGYTSYAELSEDGKTLLRYDPHGQADLADFCEQWARNLRHQRWLENAVKHPLPEGHLFELGQIVATPGALDALEKAGQTPDEFLRRHVSGKWGDLDPQDAKANNDALQEGGRLLSAYALSDGTKIWLITEWDRSCTTLLMPEEY